VTDHRAVVHLFVYGTLRPGDVRWPLLAPYVAGDGVADSVDGTLYDTGVGYPAARFGTGDAIRGLTYELLTDTVSVALELLDVEEATVEGLYRRVLLTTSAGHRAWAYEYGSGLELTPIRSGDWFER
jgi:gamma-glutamylcyclotransferase (GGCT)/AIG2-like uncharacterized protein YtfP